MKRSKPSYWPVLSITADRVIIAVGTIIDAGVRPKYAIPDCNHALPMIEAMEAASIYWRYLKALRRLAIEVDCITNELQSNGWFDITPR